MGGRGPRFSPGTEVIDRLVAQAVVLEDAKGAQTLWLSIDMIGMAWPQTSGIRQELSAMTGIPFDAIVINFSHTHSGPMSGFEGYATTKQKPEDLVAYEADLIQRCLKMSIDAVETQPDITMPELAAHLFETHQMKADPAELSRFLCRCGFSYKKNSAGIGMRTR